jgi:hypothetical protein
MSRVTSARMSQDSVPCLPGPNLPGEFLEVRVRSAFVGGVHLALTSCYVFEGANDFVKCHPVNQPVVAIAR